MDASVGKGETVMHAPHPITTAGLSLISLRRMLFGPLILVVSICMFTDSPAFGEDAATQTIPLAQDANLDRHAILEEALSRFDQAQEINAEQRDRARGLFLEAARLMEGLVRAGVRNGKLEYNIGNCYLKAGRLGEAILHYRRAERLIPSDPLLQDNLKEARKRCLANIAPKSGRTFLRSVFFLHYNTSLSSRTTLLIVTYVSFWLLVTLRSFVSRRWLSTAAVICLVLSVGAGMSVAIDRWQDRNRPDGVIVAIDVAAYNGPGESYRRRFEQPLQPGVEFELRSRRGDWWKIELPDGNLGWIESGTAELVPYAQRS